MGQQDETKKEELELFFYYTEPEKIECRMSSIVLATLLLRHGHNTELTDSTVYCVHSIMCRHMHIGSPFLFMAAIQAL